MNLRSSGLQTSDGAYPAKAAKFAGILVITNGSADATAVVYDNASAASGIELAKCKVLAAENYGGVFLPWPIRARQGVYVDITGNGAAYIVYSDVE